MSVNGTPFSFFDERYARMAADLAESYARAEPFPHVVIEDFLPATVIDRVHAEFPTPEQIEWRTQHNPRSHKLSTETLEGVGESTRFLLGEFNGPAALGFLEKLTGIGGLIPDPYFVGGGLHQIERGGFLQIHADFNRHKKLGLHRRINLLLYLNRDWKEEYGGALELWDRGMSKAVHKILPVYNRCVVFSTLDWAYHGHPEKLACPEGTTRKSLALYYYSSERPAEETSTPHGTLYQARPGRRGPLWMVRACGSGALRGIGYALALPGKLLEKLGKAIAPPKY